VSPFLKVMVSDLPSPMSTVVIKITAPSSVSEDVGSACKDYIDSRSVRWAQTTKHGSWRTHVCWSWRTRLAAATRSKRSGNVGDAQRSYKVTKDASPCARSWSATSTRVDLDRLSVTNLTSAERPLHIHDCSHSYVVVACASR
jgi:hypothetical protein